jgi:hypothetical protein
MWLEILSQEIVQMTSRISVVAAHLFFEEAAIPPGPGTLQEQSGWKMRQKGQHSI